MKYKYKKRENKFTENGHTMFEEDVLQRLNRLAYLEDQQTQPQKADSDKGSEEDWNKKVIEFVTHKFITPNIPEHTDAILYMREVKEGILDLMTQFASTGKESDRESDHPKPETMGEDALIQKAFVFIGNNDEYAEIIPDGKVDDAAKLMADFVHNLDNPQPQKADSDKGEPKQSGLSAELAKLAKSIEDECTIDDDVSGGYLEEPFKSIVATIYKLEDQFASQSTEGGYVFTDINEEKPPQGIVREDLSYSVLVYDKNKVFIGADHYNLKLNRWVISRDTAKYWLKSIK